VTTIKDLLVDLSNERIRNRLAAHIQKLTGEYRLSLIRYRPRRSELQSRYYFGVVVKLFHEWCVEQGNDVTPDDCHECLKSRFLSKTVVDRNGEVIGEATLSTSKLTTTEFIAYIEQCAQWLAEFCGIVVPPPNKNWRQEKHQQHLSTV
jgi:hypothetical protein